MIKNQWCYCPSMPSSLISLRVYYFSSLMDYFKSRTSFLSSQIWTLVWYCSFCRFDCCFSLSYFICVATYLPILAFSTRFNAGAPTPSSPPPASYKSQRNGSAPHSSWRTRCPARAYSCQVCVPVARTAVPRWPWSGGCAFWLIFWGWIRDWRCVIFSCRTLASAY